MPACGSGRASLSLSLPLSPEPEGRGGATGKRARKGRPGVLHGRVRCRTEGMPRARRPFWTRFASEPYDHHDIAGTAPGPLNGGAAM
eukprot:9311066-Pyramimonas_sp.AAC.1